MNTKSPLFKVPFRWGLVGGVIASIAIAVLFFSGQHPFLIPAIFDFRIILFGVFIFFSLKELRDYYLQRLLFFWQGMIGSFVFITTSALIGSIFTWCFAKWNDNFLPSYIEKLHAQLVSYKEEIIKSVGVETYNQQLAKLSLTSPLDLASDYFLKSMIIGLFLAIVVTTILRKQPKTE